MPFERQLGIASAALFVFGLAYALLRWREGHNAMVLVFLVGLMLPSTLSLAFPREVPSAGRGVGLLQDKSWEVWSLNPSQPPLSDLSGPALSILNPSDSSSLALLRCLFPHGLAINHRDGDGSVAYIAFYTGVDPTLEGWSPPNPTQS